MLASQYTKRYAHVLVDIVVGTIVSEVDDGGGMIILAHGVYVGGLARGGNVGHHGLRGERFEARMAQTHQLADIEIGRGVDGRPGKRRQLNQEGPMSVDGRKRHVGVLVHC